MRIIKGKDGLYQKGLTPVKNGVYCRCRKCGTGVHPHNNALVISLRVAYAKDGQICTSFADSLGPKNRHFLPVYDDKDKLVCKGSPSLAQYLKPRKNGEWFEIDEREKPRMYYEVLAPLFRDAFNFQRRAFRSDGETRIYTDIVVDEGRRTKTTHHGKHLLKD